jgi:hypothetical protein
MAKKKTGKIIQMLSPENYIRKKVRSLPIYECLANSEWKEQGVAHVVIARKHTNGNITACMYLVDLFCLGIKNTQYFFNIPETEYQEMKENMEHIVFEPISYTLAHNIVFAGLEYAEDYGFKPHKDFTSITQFMLEEDTEDVELIEIECGKNGKPFYVNGPYEDQAKINQTIAQLKRTAGIGNFDFEIIDEDDNFSEDEEFDNMTIKEQRDLFQKLYAKMDDLGDDENEQLYRLTEHVIDCIVSPDLVDQYSEEYLDDFDFDITDDVFTEGMLGLANHNLSAGTCELFTQVYETANEDPEAAKLLLNDFREETPENPASCFLELVILRAENSPKYDEKIQEYYSKFPDYPLLKILMSNNQFADASIESDETVKAFTMKSLFAGRTWIHHIEAFHYLTALLTGLACLADIDRIQGLYEAYNNLELTDEEFEVMEEFVLIVKTAIVGQILSLEGES